MRDTIFFFFVFGKQTFVLRVAKEGKVIRAVFGVNYDKKNIAKIQTPEFAQSLDVWEVK